MLRMENLIETMEKSIETMENSMKTIATSMNTLSKSMNTMEKPTKTVEKMMNSANCKFCSKSQQIRGVCSKMQQSSKEKCPRLKKKKLQQFRTL